MLVRQSTLGNVSAVILPIMIRIKKDNIFSGWLVDRIYAGGRRHLSRKLPAIVGLMGHLSPLLAAILMPLSSLATLSLVALIFRHAAIAGQNSAKQGVPAALPCVSLEPV